MLGGRKFRFKLNEKQSELWSDKLMDAANLLLTGTLLTQGLSKTPDFRFVLIAVVIYIAVGVIATFLRR